MDHLLDNKLPGGRLRRGEYEELERLFVYDPVLFVDLTGSGLGEVSGYLGDQSVVRDKFKGILGDGREDLDPVLLRAVNRIHFAYNGLEYTGEVDGLLEGVLSGEPVSGSFVSKLSSILFQIQLSSLETFRPLTSYSTIFGDPYCTDCSVELSSFHGRMNEFAKIVLTDTMLIGFGFAIVLFVLSRKLPDKRWNYGKKVEKKIKDRLKNSPLGKYL